MPQIAKTVTIRASAMTLFNFVADPTNIAALWPCRVTVTDLERLAHKGRRFRWSALLAGTHFQGSCEDSEYVEGLRMVRQIRGGFRGTVAWAFGNEDGVTNVSFSLAYSTPLPLLREHTPAAISEEIEGNVDAMLLRLKSELEEEVASVSE